MVAKAARRGLASMKPHRQLHPRGHPSQIRELDPHQPPVAVGVELAEEPGQLGEARRRQVLEREHMSCST